jgi:CRISPR-associated protein Cas1
LARQVRSGDPDNREAVAARRYWNRLFDDSGFRRRRDGDDQNRLLNYGYAVLRAAVARAICAVGLHPGLGVHHHHRSDAFCLADDLIEPYRPIVDAEVVEIAGEFGTDAPLDRPVKARLLGVLTQRWISDGEDRAILDLIARSARSLAATLLDREQQFRLSLPDLQRSWARTP